MLGQVYLYDRKSNEIIGDKTKQLLVLNRQQPNKKFDDTNIRSVVLGFHITRGRENNVYRPHSSTPKISFHQQVPYSPGDLTPKIDQSVCDQKDQIILTI